VLRIEWRLECGDAVVLSGVDAWRLSPSRDTLTHESRTEDSKSITRTTAVYDRW